MLMDFYFGIHSQRVRLVCLNGSSTGRLPMTVIRGKKYGDDDAADDDSQKDDHHRLQQGGHGRHGIIHRLIAGFTDCEILKAKS